MQILANAQTCNLVRWVAGQRLLAKCAMLLTWVLPRFTSGNYSGWRAWAHSRVIHRWTARRNLRGRRGHVPRTRHRAERRPPKGR